MITATSTLKSVSRGTPNARPCASATPVRDINLSDQSRFQSGWSDHSWLGLHISFWSNL